MRRSTLLLPFVITVGVVAIAARVFRCRDEAREIRPRAAA